MENKKLTFPGCSTAEIYSDEKYVDFSIYGEHVYRLQFDEIKQLYGALNEQETVGISDTLYALIEAVSYKDIQVEQAIQKAYEVGASHTRAEVLGEVVGLIMEQYERATNTLDNAQNKDDDVLSFKGQINESIKLITIYHTAKLEDLLTKIKQL